jgi:hypothetical protein
MRLLAWVKGLSMEPQEPKAKGERPGQMMESFLESVRRIVQASKLEVILSEAATTLEQKLFFAVTLVFQLFEPVRLLPKRQITPALSGSMLFFSYLKGNSRDRRLAPWRASLRFARQA